jgi:hypothetical protein
VGLIVMVALIVPATALPQEKPKTAPSGVQAPPPAPAPVYKPPLRGAPRGRIGGGTRGAGADVIVLAALAPDHSGHTASEQPSLYWSISSATRFPVEVTVVDARSTEPVLELTVPPPVQAGLHAIPLARHGIRLVEGVPYRWYVAVVPDPNRRSKDILAGAMIERVPPPEGLVERLARARPEERPAIYAEAGLWYDALSASSELIERAPEDPTLRDQRAALLAQVGLADPGR